MTPILETHGLARTFGDVVAVDHLDLVVRPGEVHGFLGPNGAGKTTTLRLLLGLVRPTAGTIHLFGDPVVDARGRRDVGPLRRVGALVEGPGFYPFLSGRQNLRVMADHAGVRQGRVDEVLELVRLTGRARDRYAGYSLGMKQRLGLAAALLKSPDLVVLDEPTNGLDPAGVVEMRATIRGLAAAGCTVLLSSHLLAEVQQVCDRVSVIDRGRLVGELTVGSLAAQGRVRVVAAPEVRTRALLDDLLGTDRVRDGEAGALELDVAPELIPSLNRALVEADIDVHEVRWQPLDLERLFFDLTGGTSRVA